MTIHLPDDLERIIHDAVHSGRYAREEDVIRDALNRLQHDKPKVLGKAHESSKPARTKKKITEAELQQHMLEIGLISQLPDKDSDFDDPEDQPVMIEGEPLSETIIRERR